MNLVDTGIRGVSVGRPEVVTEASRPVAATIDLRGLGEVLLRRRFWIIAPAALLFGITALAVLSMSPRYTATAQVLVDAYGLQILQNELTAKPVQSDSFLTDIESQVHVIASDGVLTKVVEREKLGDDPEFGAAPLGVVAMIADALGIERAPSDVARRALLTLQKRVDAKRLDKTSVINISAWSKDPQKAARIANAITAVYFERQAEAKAQAANRANSALLTRLSELRDLALQSEAAVEAFKARNEIVGASGRLVNEQQLNEMNTELTVARRRTAEQRARYGEIGRLRKDQVNPDSISELGLSPTFSALRARYAEAKQAQAYALAEFGPRHPSIVAMSAQIKQLRSLLDDEITRMERTALSDLNRAIASEQAVEQKLESLKRLALSTNDALVRLRELEREAESNRSIYSSLMVRSKELAEQRQVDTTNSRVITKAIAPERKSGPSSLVLLAGALALGAFVGIGIALVREQFDPWIRVARQVSEEFGLPVLAALPAPSICPSADATGWGKHTSLAVELSLPEAEQLGSLRDSIGCTSFSKAARVVMLTALDQSDNLAAVGLNLAALAAHDGDNVLLIDGDQQRVLKSAGVSKPSSPASVSGTGQSVILDNVICTSHPAPEEYALSTGTGRRGLRQRGRFQRDLINEQRGVFDLILFVWTASASSAKIGNFVDLIDDVILVVETGRSRKDDLRRAIQAMRENRAPLRGIVLLGADDRGIA